MVDTPHLDEDALAELQDVMEDEFDMLIQTYINDSSDRIANLKTALIEGKADAFTKTAHSFKGSCINIGAPRLGELCREAEAVGRDERLGDAPPLLATIEAEFGRVTDGLHALMARGVG
ncbi:MAG: Hpt domain-containing protein [Marinobacter sp.]|uniref:Hpt domain-containing protein n=1 Tax=Marinobacter sp. TaxID=50741 RepID=UPI003F9534A2